MTAHVKAREVPLIRPIREFPRAGRAVTRASGKVIRQKVSSGDIPIDRAASCSPLSTASSPARMLSELYAASLSVKARITKTMEDLEAIACE